MNEPVDAVSVWIDPRYGDKSAVIAATIEQLLAMAGWRTDTASASASATLSYGPDVMSPWRCAPVDAWLSSAPLTPAHVQGLTVPSAAIVDGVIDPVLAAYLFLTGAHEAGIEQAGQTVPDRRIAEWGLTETPVVDRLVAVVAGSVTSLHSQPARPRWPNGKRWALALSHDCDRPSLHIPGAYLRDAARFFRSGRLGAGARACAQAAYCIASGLLRADPYERSIRDFIALEQSIGLKGVYYFGVWSRFEEESTRDDLPYSHRSRRVARLARMVADSGMEIGLHSGIQAWTRPDRLAEEAQRFEAAYGCKPVGMRAHFWSLEPNAPERTLRHAASAGFDYDSSYGMNETPGYRRGVAYPFTPFDPETGSPCGLTALPPIIMDDALASLPEDRWVPEFHRYVERARETNTALILDWHSDTYRSPRWEKVTHAIMTEVEQLARTDTECWLVGCADIARWASEDRWK